jgi:hypothetical protein
MKKKKIELGSLKIQSFITSIDREQQLVIKGATDRCVPTYGFCVTPVDVTIIAPTDNYNCPTVMRQCI